MAGAEDVKFKQWAHLKQTTGRTRTINLEHILSVPEAAYSLLPDPGLFDNCHTMWFTNINSIKMEKKLVGGGKHTCGMYFVDSKKVDEDQALTAPEKNVKILNVSHTRPACSDHLAIRRMMERMLSEMIRR